MPQQEAQRYTLHNGDESMEQHKKVNQFYISFDKELNELSVQGIEELEMHWKTHNEEIEKDFALIINTLISKKRTELKHVIISPLCTSFITGEYECLLVAYDENIYLDMNEEYESFKIPGLEKVVKDDIKRLVKEFEYKDIEIEEYKISQLKFDYAFMYFDTLRNLFNELVIKLRQKQGLELSNIDISFGWYMERSEILGGERP